MFKIFKNLKSNLLLLVLFMGGLSAHSFASQNLEEDLPEDRTYLGGVVNNWKPQDTDGVYVFYMNDVMEWGTSDHHPYHVNARQKLPDFWTIKYKDGSFKKLSVIYPDWEKVFINLWQKGQSVILWYCYNTEVIHKYLEASLVSYSTPERIKGHIQTLIDHNALELCGGMYDAAYTNSIQRHIGKRSPIMIGNLCMRCETFLPRMGVQPNLYGHVQAVCEDRRNFQGEKTGRPDETKTLCRQQVACIMGMIEEIEAHPGALRKQQKLGAILDVSKKFDRKWQPPYLSSKEPMEFHPKTAMWVSVGEGALNLIAEKIVLVHPPVKAYGSPDYERARTLKALKKGLEQKEEGLFGRDLPKDYEAYLPHTDAILRMVQSAGESGNKIIFKDDDEKLMTLPSFLGLLKGVQHIRFEKLSLNPQKISEMWDWLIQGDQTKTLSFSSKLNISLNIGGQLQTFPLSLESISVGPQSLNLQRLGSGAWEVCSDKKKRETQGEEAFFAMIKDHAMVLQQSRGPFKSLTLNWSGIDLGLMLGMAGSMALEEVNFSELHNSEGQNLEPLLNYLGGLKNLRKLDVYNINWGGQNLMTLLSILEDKPIVKLHIRINRESMTFEEMKKVMVKIVEFLGNNDSITDLWSINMQHAHVEDFKDVNLAYNTALYKLRQERKEKGEVTLETLSKYERRLTSLPKWHKKVIPNVVEVYGLGDHKEARQKIKELRLKVTHKFYTANQKSARGLFY